MVTVREFGQGGFCASTGGGAGASAAADAVRTLALPPPPWDADTTARLGLGGAGAVHLDVSAGLGVGEWGMFALPHLVAPPSDGESAGFHMVAYVRAGRHLSQLARWTVWWWWDAVCDGSTGAGEVATELTWHHWCDPLPLRDLAFMLRSAADALRSAGRHALPPWEVLEDADADCAVVHAPALRRRLRVVPRSHARADGAATALDPSAFWRLLSTSRAVVVTGDASLNEAIVAASRRPDGLPLAYVAEPHKVFAARDLAASAATAPHVAQAWSFTSRPGSTDPAGLPRWMDMSTAFRSWACGIVGSRADASATLACSHASGGPGGAGGDDEKRGSAGSLPSLESRIQAACAHLATAAGT
jgi:hypothetical protein